MRGKLKQKNSIVLTSTFSLYFHYFIKALSAVDRSGLLDDAFNLARWETLDNNVTIK